MQRLIEDLLRFSRVATHGRPFVPVDLAEVTREVLDDLEAQVAMANQTLRAAEANYRAARAAIGVAGAGLFPTVGASGSVARARSGSGSSNGGGGGSRASYAASLDAQWEIDLWGRVRRLVEAAQDTAQASAADVENTRLSLQSEVAIDYLQLRVADAARRVLEETVAGYERSLVLTQNRYNAGVAARVDVVQGEAQLLAARASLVDIQATRAQLEHAIAALLGKAPADFSVAVVETVPAVPDVPAGVPSELLERRPDIAAAERRVAAANAQVGAATAAIFPTLTLNASGGFIGSSLANWLSLPNRVWSLSRRSQGRSSTRGCAPRSGRKPSPRTTRRSRTTARPCSTHFATSRTTSRSCASWTRNRACRPRRCARHASR